MDTATTDPHANAVVQSCGVTTASVTSSYADYPNTLGLQRTKNSGLKK